jgi:hypothetical protein
LALTCPSETSPTAQGVSPINTIPAPPLFTPKKAVVRAGLAVRPGSIGIPFVQVEELQGGVRKRLRNERVITIRFFVA